MRLVVISTAWDYPPLKGGADMRCWFYLLLALLLAMPALGLVLRSDGDVTIGAGEVINDDVLVTGGTVNVFGKISNDLIIAAGNVAVSGSVGGDLIVGGGNVTVSGPVAGSIYAGGGNITLTSTVGRNVAVGGGTVIVDKAARITRDLAVGAGNVTLAGTVGRDLQVNSGTLTLTDSARVTRNLLAYTSSPSIAAGAVIGGQRIIRKQPEQRQPAGGWFAMYLFHSLFYSLGLLLVGLPLIALAPRLTDQTESMLKTHPWGSLLAGFLVLIAAPIAILIVAITCLGLPLAFVLWSLYLVALIVSPIFTAILIGRFVMRQPGARPAVALLLGLLVLAILLLLPVISFLTGLAALLFGLGALTLTVQSRSKSPIFAAPSVASGATEDSS